MDKVIKEDVLAELKTRFSVLNELRDLCIQEAKDKGWHTELNVNVAAFIANLHGEVSELWEAWRKGALDKPCDKAEKMVSHGLEPLTNAEEEIADIIIRVLDTAAVMKVDVERAVLGKLLFNRTRPHRNGGKLA